MTGPSQPLPSARKTELLERAYRYVQEHGLVGMSLRPLAEAIGSSPRVLLFLFGSKDGLVRALLDRAREDEREILAQVRGNGGTLADVVLSIWGWLADPGHGRLLALWAEAYSQSLIDPAGPWAGFARQTVADWLALLADAHPADSRPADSRPADAAERTAALALLRGAMLDLLATGDRERTSAAVTAAVTAMTAAATEPAGADRTRRPAREASVPAAVSTATRRRR